MTNKRSRSGIGLGLRERARCFFAETAGATASEYAVILALLIIAALVSINALGMSMTGSFTNIGSNLSAVSGDRGPR